jgi:hypothetical protein
MPSRMRAAPSAELRAVQLRAAPSHSRPRPCPQLFHPTAPSTTSSASVRPPPALLVFTEQRRERRARRGDRNTNGRKHDDGGRGLIEVEHVEKRRATQGRGEVNGDEGVNGYSKQHTDNTRSRLDQPTMGWMCVLRLRGENGVAKRNPRSALLCTASVGEGCARAARGCARAAEQPTSAVERARRRRCRWHFTTPPPKTSARAIARAQARKRTLRARECARFCARARTAPHACGVAPAHPTPPPTRATSRVAWRLRARAVDALRAALALRVSRGKLAGPCSSFCHLYPAPFLAAPFSVPLTFPRARGRARAFALRRARAHKRPRKRTRTRTHVCARARTRARVAYRSMSLPSCNCPACCECPSPRELLANTCALLLTATNGGASSCEEEW